MIFCRISCCHRLQRDAQQGSMKWEFSWISWNFPGIKTGCVICLRPNILKVVCNSSAFSDIRLNHFLKLRLSDFQTGHTHAAHAFNSRLTKPWMKSRSTEFSHTPYLLVSFGGFSNSRGEFDKILSQPHSFHSDHKTQRTFSPNRTVLVGQATRHGMFYTARPWNN